MCVNKIWVKLCTMEESGGGGGGGGETSSGKFSERESCCF